MSYGGYNPRTYSNTDRGGPNNRYLRNVICFFVRVLCICDMNYVCIYRVDMGIVGIDRRIAVCASQAAVIELSNVCVYGLCIVYCL